MGSAQGHRATQTNATGSARTEVGAHGGETRSRICPTMSSSQSDRVEASRTRAASSAGTRCTLTWEGDPTDNCCCGVATRSVAHHRTCGYMWCRMFGAARGELRGRVGISMMTAHCPAASFLCHSTHGARNYGGKR